MTVNEILLSLARPIVELQGRVHRAAEAVEKREAAVFDAEMAFLLARDHSNRLVRALLDHPEFISSGAAFHAAAHVTSLLFDYEVALGARREAQANAARLECALHDLMTARDALLSAQERCI